MQFKPAYPLKRRVCICCHAVFVVKDGLLDNQPLDGVVIYTKPFLYNLVKKQDREFGFAKEKSIHKGVKIDIAIKVDTGGIDGECPPTSECFLQFAGKNVKQRAYISRWQSFLSLKNLSGPLRSPRIISEGAAKLTYSR